jgi:hypothetical protein
MDFVSNREHPEVIGVTSVKVLWGYRVHLTFTDSSEGELDLEPYLWGPVFEPLRRDEQLFRSVSVDLEAQTIVWPNGADVAPETLYEDSHPVQIKRGRKTAKQTVSAARRRPVRAAR